MASDFDFFDHIAKLDTMKIKYLLFDCDNTLVLSEDPAAEICSGLINEILESLTFRKILAILQQQHDFRLNEEEVKTYNSIQGDRLDAKIRKKARAAPGVADTLARLHKLNFVLAVASSSGLRRIHTCLNATGLKQYFDDDKIFSAADSPVPSSKPHPAIYLRAIEALGASAEEVLTVEDSMSGTRAALGANIACLGYVGSTHGPAKKSEMARHLLDAGCIDILWHYGNYARHLATFQGYEKEHAERLELLHDAQASM